MRWTAIIFLLVSLLGCSGSNETCQNHNGTSSIAVLRGAVLLTPSQEIQDGVVVYDRASGKIVCVGIDCTAHYDAEDHAQVCTNGIILPGFIDAQARVHENIGAPYDPSVESLVRRDRYDDPVFQKAQDQLNIAYQNAPCAVQIWGELHALLAGTTSIRPSGPSLCAKGLVRNIDRGFSEGLSAPPTADWGQIEAWLPSSNEEDLKIALETGTVRRLLATLEDDTSTELQILDEQGLLSANTTLIHATDLSQDGVDLLSERGGALIWTPESDLRIVGRTPPVAYARSKGVHLSLGSDGTLLGSGNMLRAMKCARHISVDALEGSLTAKEIVEMATLGGAVSTGSIEELGLIQPGHKADLTVIRGDPGSPYDAVINAENKDVALVIVDGKVRFGDEKWTAALTQKPCLAMEQCGMKRMLCDLDQDGALMSIPHLQFLIQGSIARALFRSTENREESEVQNIIDALPYGLYHCEPAADLEEACSLPSIPEFDTVALDLDPSGWLSDSDADGLHYFEDNCLIEANPEQSDSDQDGLGDLCDPCPNIPNPDGQNCLFAIQDLRNPNSEKHPQYGTPVRMENLVVTGIRDPENNQDRLISVQDPNEPNFGSISIFIGSRPIEVELDDLIAVEGAYMEFYGGSYILGDPKIERLGAYEGEMKISDIPIDHIEDGSSFLEAYEASLVQIKNVVVLQMNETENPEGQQLGFHVWNAEQGISPTDDAAFVGDFFYQFAKKDLPAP